MNVRAIVAWTLYDFANSSCAAVIFATIYAGYDAIGRFHRRIAGRPNMSLRLGRRWALLWACEGTISGGVLTLGPDRA